MKIVEVLDVLIPNTEKFEVKFDSSKDVKAVLLNYGDEAYMKIILDKYSSDFFLKNVYKIEDNLSKGLIWRSLWDTIRDGKESSLKFLEAALDQLPQE